MSAAGRRGTICAVSDEQGLGPWRRRGRACIPPLVVPRSCCSRRRCGFRQRSSGPWSRFGYGCLLAYRRRRQLDYDRARVRSETAAAASRPSWPGRTAWPWARTASSTCSPARRHCWPWWALGAAVSPLFAWKAELAAACSREANYLGVTLREWQRHRNGRSPDLTADVDLRLVGGNRHRTDLAGPGQPARSRAGTAGVRGTVPVRAGDPGPIGGEQALLVGRHVITLPADGSPAGLPRPVGPVVLLAPSPRSG